MEQSDAQPVGKMWAAIGKGHPVSNRVRLPFASKHPGSKKVYEHAPLVITRRGGNTWRAVTRARRSAPYLRPEGPWDGKGWRR